MVLCSDGIYEFMTNDDIVNLVHAQAEQGAMAAQIAQHLVRSCACFLKCWRNMSWQQVGQGHLAFVGGESQLSCAGLHQGEIVHASPCCFAL